MNFPFTKKAVAPVCFIVGLTLFSTFAKAQTNSITIGSTSVNSNAVLWLVPNGAQGFLLPSVSTVARTSMNAKLQPADKGMMIFDGDLNKLFVWNGSIWVDLLADPTGSTTVALTGDVTGLSTQTIVSALRGHSISTTAPADKQVLKWNAATNQWEPATETAASAVKAGSGINVAIDNTISVPAGAITSAMIADGTIASVDLASGSVDDSKITSVSAGKLTQSGAAVGQVLKWNGTAWSAGADAGTAYTAGSGISITGTSIAADIGTNAGQLVGVLAGGKLPALDGSNLTNVSSAIPPLGGDISGTLPVVSVDKIKGNAVTGTPTLNQVLQYNGTSWAPATISGGGTITGVTTSGSSGLSGGGLSGTLALKLTDGASTGQILKWNGTGWALASDDVGSGGAPTLNPGQIIIGDGASNSGVGVSGDLTMTAPANFQIAAGAIVDADINSAANIGVTKLAAGTAGQILQTIGTTPTWTTISTGGVTSISGTAPVIVTGTTTPVISLAPLSGDVGGTITATSVDKIKGVALSATAPVTNQVLQFDGTVWAPANLSGGGTITGVTTGGTSGLSGGGLSGTLALKLIDGASTGQILKWNGTGWALATDDVGGGGAPTLNPGQLIVGDGTTNSGAGVSGDLTMTGAANFQIAAGAIADADINSAANIGVTKLAPGSAGQVLQTIGTTPTWTTLAGGGSVTNVTGTAPISVATGTTTPVISLNNTAVTPGSYGTSTSIPQITVDAQGRLTAASANAIPTASPSVTGLLTSADWSTFNGKLSAIPALGGDISGTLPAVSVDKLKGTGISATAPTINQILQFNGSSWAPATFAAGGTVTSVGTGTGLTGGPFSTSGTISLANTAVTAATYGDATHIPQLVIDAQGRITTAGNIVFTPGFANPMTALGDIILGGTAGAPTRLGIGTNGQVLTSNGTTAAWQNLSGGGTITGVTTSGASGLAGGGLSGTLALKLIDGASAGQILKWDGSAWALGTDNVGGGGAPTLNPGQLIIGDGTSNSAAGVSGDLTMIAPANFQIAANAVTTAEIAAATIIDSDISGTAAIAVTKLAPGTAGQVLQTTGTTPTWTTIATGATDLNGLSDAIISAPSGGQILINDGAGQFQNRSVSGAVTINTTGVTTLSNGAVSGGAAGTITDATIVNVDIAAAAAIDGSKITPAFGSQAISTTGSVTAGSVNVNGQAYTWPGSQSSGVLTNNGTGGLTWAPAGGSGTVTNVTGTAPISVATGTTTPVISLNNTAVTPGSYGTSTSIPQITVDAQGRLTAASANAIPTASTSVTGLLTSADWNTFNGKLSAIPALGGDISGTLPAVSVDKIKGVSISATAPTLNQVLQYNGTAWAPATAGGFANPMTAAGDLIYGGIGGTPTRLATGTGFLRGGSTPSYSSINLATADVTGTLPITNGGTGATTAAAALANLGGLNSSLTSGNILVGNASNVATAVAISGDATISNTGALTIASAAISGGTGGKIADATITDADINGSASIAGSKITPAFGAQAISTTSSVTAATVNVNSLTYTWPGTQTSGVLTNNGTGGLTWAPAGGSGTVTNVTGTAPISVATGTTTPVISLNNTAVTPGSYGTSTSIPQITVDAQGRLTAASANAIPTASTSVTGLLTSADWNTFNGKLSAIPALGGDISGTLPAVSVDKIKGVSISATAPTLNQVLQYNGTAWAPATGASGWGLTGNAGTVDGTNFIGTTDNVPFTIKVNNQKAGRIDPTALNTFWGFQAGNLTTSAGIANTATGALAFAVNTNGGSNSAYGYSALAGNTSGGQNTAIGRDALQTSTTGVANTGVGSAAIQNNTTGGTNSALGYVSLAANTIGSSNTAIGASALNSNVAGNNATAVGNGALQYANSSSSAFTNTNVAVGFESLRGSTTASANTGLNNTALGYHSLMNNTTGSENLAIGYNAGLSITTSSKNSFVGSQAGASNTTGNQNHFFGWGSGFSNTTGNNNHFFGYNPGYNNTTGNNNHFFGSGAGYNNTTGSDNTFVGDGAGSNNVGGGTNTFIGGVTGLTNTTGSSNTALGYQADMSSAGLTKAVAIGYNAKVSTSSTMVLGGTGADAVKVGIGGATATEVLDVVGNVKFSGALMPNNLPGSAGQVLTSAGAGVAPTWATAGGGFSTNNSVPRGNGTTLVASLITDDGNGVAINNNSSPSGSLTLINADPTGYGLKSLQRSAIQGGGAGGIINTNALTVNNNVGTAPTLTPSGTIGTLSNAASTSSEQKIGASGSAAGSAGIKYGIFGTAEGSGTNYGGYAYGTGGTSNYGSTNLATGGASSTNTAVQGAATTTSGSATTNIGGSFFASGTATGQNVGVFGSATGGATNFGGYFQNNLAVASGGIAVGGSLNFGTTGQVLTSAGPGASPTWSAAGGGWGLTGNAGTVDGTNFIGTTDNVALNFKVNNNKSGRIDPSLGNTFFGYLSGTAATSGGNTGFGASALQTNTSGQDNTAVGDAALAVNTSGSANTADGRSALKVNTTGSSNTAVGYNTLFKNVSNSNNTAVGSEALTNNTADYNTAVGVSALYTNTTGSQNIAIGVNSLFANTSGSYNTASGYNALASNTTGGNNVAIGPASLSSNITGAGNTAVGSGSLQTNTASNNTAIGVQALGQNSSGSLNTASGNAALAGNTTGSDNTANGNGALLNNTTGFGNTASGSGALSANNTGSSNVAVGYRALSTNTTGSSNTMLGYFADVSSNNLTNATAIGANAVVTASNSIVLGNGAKVGIGVSAPASTLEVEGDISGGAMMLFSQYLPAQTLGTTNNTTATVVVTIPIYIPAGTSQVRGKITHRGTIVGAASTASYGIGANTSGTDVVNGNTLTTSAELICNVAVSGWQSVNISTQGNGVGGASVYGLSLYIIK